MANPFDDDVDISSFYKPQNKKTPISNSPSEDFNFYEQQIEQILQGTVDSSSRGVMMLEESEQIGIATAQDLVNQGEKLQKVNRQLDDINITTKQSQKHLNNIKSIFGGIKNYFAKSGSNERPLPASDDGAKSASKLNTKVEQLSDQAMVDASKAGKAGTSSLPESSRAALANTRWEVMNNQVDENLDLMSANLRRLRDLGSALGQEIDEQNSMLDKIAVNAEKADVEIRHQDRQMKKILGSVKTKSKSGEESEAPSILGGKLKK